MLKLLSLTFNNIGCFIEEQTIDFSNRDKLIQVDGVNESTGGSSGAGKTTVFKSLDYLLGISDTPATALQSRLTKKPITVTGKFQIDGNLVNITRSKKGGLSILFPDNPDSNVSGNVKLAEEKLDELIGIQRKIFKKMVHKRQKDGGFFLDMTAKEIYEFLLKMLGLESYSEKVEKIGEDIKTHLKAISKLEVFIETTEGSIKESEEAYDALVEPTCTVEEEQVTELKELVEQCSKNIALIKEEKIKAFLEHTKPEPTKTEFDDTELKKIGDELLRVNTEKHKAEITYRAKIQEISDEINLNVVMFSKIKRAKTDVEVKKTEILRLKGELDKVIASICPTCAQNWVTEKAEAHMETLKTSITRLASESIKLNQIIGVEAKLDEKQNELAKNLEKMKTQGIDKGWDAQISNLEFLKNEQIDKRRNISREAENEYMTLKNAWQEKILAIEKKFNEGIDSHNSIMLENNTKYLRLKAELDKYDADIKRYNLDGMKLKKALVEKRVFLSGYGKERSDAAQDILIAEEAKRLIKTYTLQIFQNTLDEIGDVATEILNGIPNMSTSTIYFEGCKENANGSIRDEVNAIINKDGENGISIKSLSGGERTAIDLAVDLAVIDIIENKANKGADFYITDEPFDGLDAICKEQCLSILSRIDTNKKIIMVDHSSELKQMVSDIIVVKKSGETSSIVV